MKSIAVTHSSTDYGEQKVSPISKFINWSIGQQHNTLLWLRIILSFIVAF